jgi:hypothetical protein
MERRNGSIIKDPLLVTKKQRTSSKTKYKNRFVFSFYNIFTANKFSL